MKITWGMSTRTALRNSTSVRAPGGVTEKQSVDDARKVGTGGGGNWRGERGERTGEQSGVGRQVKKGVLSSKWLL